MAAEDGAFDSYLRRPEAYDPLATVEAPLMLTLDSAFQGTVLAGRERPFAHELEGTTSEAALHRYRAEVEIEALIYLAEHGPLSIDIDEQDKSDLRRTYDPNHFDPEQIVMLDHFGTDDAKPLEHDVKAVEVYLGRELSDVGLDRLVPYLHFGMTSEDVNNLAFNMMLRDATNGVLLPAISRVADRLAFLAATYADTPTVGRTHAQPASPTTLGKQYAYHLAQITTVAEELDGMRLTGKFGGAVGNHNPMPVLFPDFDYEKFSQGFVESLGFDYAPIQNQRNDHLAISRYLSTLTRFAVVGQDTAMNLWLQINDGKLGQIKVEGEKGSSTMAHKINPWRLENAEPYFEQAIALVGAAHSGLAASRHERDISDHGWQRAYGDMIGRVVAAYNYMAVQMDRLVVNEDAVKAGFDGSYEVLSELLQTAGRISGDPEAYNKVGAATQGKKLDQAAMTHIIKGLFPSDMQRPLLAVTPDLYVGSAGRQARQAVLGWDAAKTVLRRGVLDESTSIDAVLLDLDGTLHFGDKQEVRARLMGISEQLDLGFGEDRISYFASSTSDFAEMISKMLFEANLNLPDGKKCTFEEIMSANDAISGTLDHLFYTADGAHEALQAVRETGKKTALVTTRGNKSRDRVLALHGFTDLFDVIIGRGDADRRKPHPEPIAIALEKLGIKDPRRTMYVGDLQTDDVGAGNALGMKTALVGTTAIDPYGPKPTYIWLNLKPLTELYGRR